MLHSISAHIAGWVAAIAGGIYGAAPHRVHVERRYYVYALLLCVACFTYTAALSAIYSSDKSEEFWKFAGLFLGPTLVAVGWVVTNEVNTRNSRKQHTVNLIMQYFTNAKRIEDKEMLNTKLPFPAILNPAEVDFDDTSNPVLRAATRELNYFDYLSSAVLHREIDEQLLRRVFGIVIRNYCIQLGPYITHWRGKDESFWSDLVELEKMWREEERRSRGQAAAARSGT